MKPLLSVYPLRLWADFTEFPNGTGWTTLRCQGFIPDGHPIDGEIVELWDHEGNTCSATVERTDDCVVYASIILGTWRDPVVVEWEKERNDD